MEVDGMLTRAKLHRLEGQLVHTYVWTGLGQEFLGLVLGDTWRWSELAVHVAKCRVCLFSELSMQLVGAAVRMC